MHSQINIRFTDLLLNLNLEHLITVYRILFPQRLFKRAFIWLLTDIFVLAILYETTKYTYEFHEYLLE